MIPHFPNRSRAAEIPMLRQAGSEGGTVVVIRSRDFITVSLKEFFSKKGNEIQKPTNAINPINRIYFTESLWNLISTSLGNKIERIKFPFTVLNPVLKHRPSTGEFPADLFCIILVPAYKKYFLSFSLSNCDGMLGKCAFIIGVDSPVSIASFTITVPVSRTQSQGRAAPSSGMV